MSKPKFKIPNLNKAIERRDIALHRLHEYYTALLDGRIRIVVADLEAFADSLPGYIPGKAVRS